MRLAVASLLASLLASVAACGGGGATRSPAAPLPDEDDDGATADGPGAPAGASDAPAWGGPGQPRYRIDHGELILPSPVAYQVGSDQLDPASGPALDHIAAYLTDKPIVTLLRIEVHGDEQALTERRAAAVARALIDRGVACDRLIAVGFGTSKPVADAATPEGKAQNRRTVVVNAALRGRAVGGVEVDGGGQVALAPCAAP